MEENTNASEVETPKDEEVMKATFSTPEEPDVAGEAPPEDPNVVGTLELNEIQQLNFMRQQSTQVTLQIGQLEVQKTGLIGRLGEFERQAQEAMQAVGKRLNIPDGAQWQVGMDGKVRLLAPPAAPTSQPQAKPSNPRKAKLGLVGTDGNPLPQ